MSATTNITSLPQEILQEILLLVADLKTLRRIIQSHWRLYAAFQDRRSFILTAIFRREVFDVGMRKRDVFIGNPLTTSSLMHASWYMKRLKQNLKMTKRCSDVDLVTLREALWPYFSQLLYSPTSNSYQWGHALDWARAFIHILARIPSKAPAALSLGTEIWTAVVRQGVPVAREERDTARTLIRLYQQENRPDDAFAFQEAVLDRLDPDSAEGSIWATQLFKDYRSAGRIADEVALQKRLWDTARASRGAGSEKAQKWARRVVCTYQETGLPAAAAEFQARVFALLEPGSWEYVVCGRGLLKMLKRAGNRVDEVLVVRAEVWRHYSPFMQGYFVWAKQMCVELRARRRENEAIRVEEDVWNTYKTSRAVSWGANGAVASFHGRAAGASLARAYRRRWQVAAAERIEAQLSRGRLKF